MALTGDTLDLVQGGVVTSSAQIVDAGATVGDVLTVQADKSIAAAPGGGSQPDVLTRATLDFQESAGAGTYTASIDLPAGAIVASVFGTPLVAPWDADAASLDVGDVLSGADAYFAGVSIAAAAGAPLAITAVDQGGPYAITSVDQVAKTFKVAGDHTLVYGGGMTVAGSTGNDGGYTVPSIDPATFDGTHTTFPVAEPIPSAIADGTITLSDSTVTVAGDETAQFPASMTVAIAGSTGNDGGYSCGSNAALVSGDTVIRLGGLLPDGTADGTIQAQPPNLLNAAYDPASVTVNNALNGSQWSGTSIYTAGAFLFPFLGGNGVLYVNADTITAAIVTNGAGGSTGHLQIVVLGFGVPAGLVAAVKS